MKKFENFLYKNFTVSVLISVISFRIYVSLLDNIINPITSDFIDKDKIISDYKVIFGDVNINVGLFIKDLISSFIVVLIIYNLANSM